MADQIDRASRPWALGSTFYIALLSIVMVFGAIVGIVTWQLRGELREQIIYSKAQSLLPLAQFQIDRNLEDSVLGELDLEDVLILSLLDTYDMEEALGLEVFDAVGGSIMATPEGMGSANLTEADLARLQAAQVKSVFHQQADATMFFGRDQQVIDLPILEMRLPLQAGKEGAFAGVARYLMDGTETQVEYEKLDTKLARHAAYGFFAGTLFIVVISSLAARRLRGANRELQRKAQHLSEANAELAMVAKTSAVGAMASHLIHGLKNPLAGLRQHVATGGEGLVEEDWRDAEAATKRMQAMINEVVDALKADAGETHCSISAQEIADTLGKKFSEQARLDGIELEIQVATEAELGERVANIVLLILSNLAQNALEAAGPGGEVCLGIQQEDQALVALVRDTGPGFSPESRERLFQPGASNKAQGAGIGLAICKQLSRHIEASLELIESSSEGSSMRLSVPL